MPDNYDQNKVQFEGERSMLYSRFEPSNKTPALVEMLMKWGIAKTKNQAKYMLIGLALIGMIVALFLIFGGGGTVGSPKDIKILPAVP